jgi:hypothetical protein
MADGATGFATDGLSFFATVAGADDSIIWTSTASGSGADACFGLFNKTTAAATAAVQIKATHIPRRLLRGMCRSPVVLGRFSGLGFMAESIAALAYLLGVKPVV